MIRIPINDQPTKSELLNIFNQCTKKEKYIYYCIAELNENIFSFLCGVIISLPISIVFNLISFNIENNIYNYVYLGLYVLLLIISIVMSVYSIKFTIKHIEIHNNLNFEKNEEKYKNILARNIFDSMKELKLAFNVLVSQAIMFSSIIIVMFIINNVFKIVK